MLPQAFPFCFPLPPKNKRFSFKIQLVVQLDQKELLPDWKSFTHQKTFAWCWRTPFGTFQTPFAPSQSHCYKCNHRDAYTFTAHWMYNVELTFRGRKFLNISIVSFHQSAHFPKYEERGRKLGSDFTHFMCGQKAKQCNIFSTTTVPSRPLDIGAVHLN